MIDLSNEREGNHTPSHHSQPPLECCRACGSSRIVVGCGSGFECVERGIGAVTMGSPPLPVLLRVDAFDVAVLHGW